MSEEIRSFNSEGNKRFASFVNSLKSDPTIDPPWDLLTDPSVTDSLPDSPQISRDSVATKMDLAQKIHVATQNLAIEELDKQSEEGLWNWLSLFFFDTITNGRKEFGEVHRFVLSRNWNRRSRHLIESTYNAYRIHGEYASVILENKPWKGGEVFNNLAGTQEYWMNQSLFKIVHSLYWDSKNNKPKIGITPRQKPGTIRRLISFLNQLNRTFDLFALSPEEFRMLIPKEFERWSESSHESN
jgi:hypothetical protein